MRRRCRLQPVVERDARPRIRQPGIVERTAAAGSGGVAEAAQPLFLFGGDRIGLRAIAARRNPRKGAHQLIVHPLRAIGLLGSTVVPLVGIVR